MMLKARSTLVLATIALAIVSSCYGQETPPHLSQAWQAESTGDGLPKEIGKESYIYEGCKERTDTCMNGHVFDYGAQCIKYEVDRGYSSRYSGTYYVNCHSVDCCTKAKSGPEKIPTVKKWDIGMAGKLFRDQIVYLGKKDTTELNNKPVKGADTWLETFTIPFGHVPVNYTYYITGNGTDVITHRIDFGAPGKGGVGSILYGNFQIQKNLTAFRGVFEPPAACLKRNVLTCPKEKVNEWEEKYFKRSLVSSGKEN